MEVQYTLVFLLVMLCCVRGVPHRKRPDCAAVSCMLPSCPNFFTPPGECCPVCPQGRCSYKNRVLADGQTLKDGCNSCTCRGGYLACENLPRYCFDVDCPDLENCHNPYTPPGECCQRCGTGTCFHDGKYVAEGETVQVDCNPCTCSNGLLQCTEKVCRRCSYKNRVLAEGQTLKDGCNLCTCRDGNLVCKNLPRYCFDVDCPDLEDCYNPYTPPGECCQRCGTDCRLAFCGLPPPNCELYTPPGQCCEVCKTRTCFNNGKYVAEGETVQVDCNTCTCSNGVLQCSLKACLEEKPGSCPKASGPGVCFEQCSTDQSCRGNEKCCSNGCGHVCMDPVPEPSDCSNVICEPLPRNCKRFSTPPGQCCPVCRKFKHFGHRRYRG